MEVKELGHVVLFVRDLETSRTFYRDVLGWREVMSMEGRSVGFSAGRTHHELLLIEVGKDATPIPAGRRIGMYHFGVKIGDSDDDLRAALERLQEQNVTIVGAADHAMTHSLYIQDPDGNEVELYVDMPKSEWYDEEGKLIGATKPLRL